MVSKKRPEPPPDVVRRVAKIALALPDAYEEEAWTGVRWRVRMKTFAHVLVITPDRAAYYFGEDDRARTVVTFRSEGEELLALVNAGPPFLKPPWSPTIVGLVLDNETDWAEVSELVTESFRILAPQKLRRLLDSPSR